MVSTLYEWVKNIVFYMVLVTAVMNVLPNSSYKKYIKLFTGMIMIILVLTPINKLLGIDSKLDNAFIKNMYSQSFKINDSEIKEVFGSGQLRLIEEYETEIEKNISDLILEGGFYPVEVEAVINSDESSSEYGTLCSIKAVISRTETDSSNVRVNRIVINEDNIETPEEITVKNTLINFYNLNSDNINISIQG